MKSNKEIERKFLINNWPSETPVVEGGGGFQAYISIDPEVRIRAAHHKGKPMLHFLTIKSNGELIRDEIEVKISKAQYDALVAMTGLEPIKKELKKYQLPDGHILECCNVDPGTENNFMYAEVEFEDEDTANKFTPLPIFTKEVTSDASFKMKNYWTKTRINTNKDSASNDDCKCNCKFNKPDPENNRVKDLEECLDIMGPFGEFLMKVINPDNFDPTKIFEDMDPRQLAEFTARQAVMIHEHLDEFGFNDVQLYQIRDIIQDELTSLYKSLTFGPNSFAWYNPEEGEYIAHGIGKIKTGMGKKKVKKLVKKRVNKALDEFLRSKKLRKMIHAIAKEEAIALNEDSREDLDDLEERVSDIEEHMEDIDNTIDNMPCGDGWPKSSDQDDEDSDD